VSTRLIQVLAFPNVGASATVTQNHDININGASKRPDFIAADAAGFTVTATDTQVSVTNNNAAPASVNVWLELKHTIPRELGGLANLTPQPFVASPGGSGGGTSGGAAGIVGAGTALDPYIPVAGPFRPVDTVYVMDDYHVAYGPLTGGVPSVQGVGYTSILRTPGPRTQFSCNKAAGYLGPSSMMGVMDLQLIGANTDEFISAVQARVGNDSGDAIDQAKLQGEWDLWWAARVSFEGLNDFEATQKAFAGFSRQIDQPTFGNPDRAYFHPKFNGIQINWFFTYSIPDDNATNTADIDTGVKVGFTAAHPTDPAAPQNLLVRFKRHPLSGGTNCTMTAAIDGVIVVGPIEFLNPQARFTPFCAIASIAAAQSNTMYVDWMLWGVTGRTV
jgi:hypothetical protein